MKRFVVRMWRDARGQGIAEYALIAALVVVVAIVVLRLLGVEITRILQEILNALRGV